MVRRLAAQVDERRHPMTNASLDQLPDRYLETLEVAETTRTMYAKYLEKHVRPFVALLALRYWTRSMPSCAAAGSTARRQRGLVDHRTPREHECDERCRPHVCNGLSSTTIRHFHFVLRGAYEKGVRWRWVSRNPILLVDAPAARRPDPQPPTAEEAARIIDEAWDDPDY